MVDVDRIPAWYSGNQGAIFIRVKGVVGKITRVEQGWSPVGAKMRCFPSGSHFEGSFLCFFHFFSSIFRSVHVQDHFRE